MRTVVHLKPKNRLDAVGRFLFNVSGYGIRDVFLMRAVEVSAQAIRKAACHKYGLFKSSVFLTFESTNGILNIFPIPLNEIKSHWPTLKIEAEYLPAIPPLSEGADYLIRHSIYWRCFLASLLYVFLMRLLVERLPHLPISQGEEAAIQALLFAIFYVGIFIGLALWKVKRSWSKLRYHVFRNVILSEAAIMMGSGVIGVMAYVIPRLKQLF